MAVLSADGGASHGRAAQRGYRAEPCSVSYPPCMTSTLACIGLGSDPDSYQALLLRAHRNSAVVAERDDIYLAQWQDADGARITFTITEDAVLAVTPSLSSEPGARLRALTHCGDQLWSAEVIDDAGEQVTALAADIEHSALIDPHQPPSGPTAVVALGVAVEVFADAEAFSRSPASLMGDPDGEPPEEFLHNGGVWPPRLSPESFISYGVFDASMEATALLSGTVLSARTGHNSLTEQPYRVARVRTAGFEADVCLDGVEHAQPEVGSIISGEVYLVACVNPA